MQTSSKAKYDALVGAVDRTSNDALIGLLLKEFPDIWKTEYMAMTPHDMDLYAIQYKSFEYIYDNYSMLEALGKVPPNPLYEDRLVAALGRSQPQRKPRDDYRLRGWVGPTEKHFGRHCDKGHFIAHSIGGAVDQCELNVFAQRRDLNRGWSAAGKRFRLMEKYCFDNPNTFCFSRPIYSLLNGSAKPEAIEFGILKGDGELWVDVFDNR